jgi:hypothetical protein
MQSRRTQVKTGRKLQKLSQAELTSNVFIDGKKSLIPAW